MGNVKTGIVDVGGGTRGAYGAGVFDWCLENNVDFDCCIGVSAGSANAITYVAGQAGRTKRFYLDYAFRKEYMSLGNLVRRGAYVDLEYVYGTLSNADGEDPLNYPALMASDKQFIAVATDARTGRPFYFTKTDMAQDDYAPLKASSSLPVVGPAYQIGEHHYFDGGLSDPIPFAHAFGADCEKVVVILTRPRDFHRDPAKDRLQAKLLHKRYPAMEQALVNRADTYNAELDQAVRLESEGSVLIVAPASIEGLDTLTKDRSKLEDLYNQGKRDAEAIRAFLEA